MSRTAFVIPGQGEYLPGMFSKLTDDQVVQDTLEAVDEVAAKLGRGSVSSYLTCTVEDGASVLAQRDEAPERFATKRGGMTALGTNHCRAQHLLGALDAWDVAIAVRCGGM